MQVSRRRFLLLEPRNRPEEPFPPPTGETVKLTGDGLTYRHAVEDSGDVRRPNGRLVALAVWQDHASSWLIAARHCFQTWLGLLVVLIGLTQEKADRARSTAITNVASTIENARAWRTKLSVLNGVRRRIWTEGARGRIRPRAPMAWAFSWWASIRRGGPPWPPLGAGGVWGRWGASFGAGPVGGMSKRAGTGACPYYGFTKSRNAVAFARFLLLPSRTESSRLACHRQAVVTTLRNAVEATQRLPRFHALGLLVRVERVSQRWKRATSARLVVPLSLEQGLWPRRILTLLPGRRALRHAFLVAFAVTGLASVVLATAVYGYVTRELPPADQVFSTGMFQTAMIYDRKGRLLYEMTDPNGGRRDVIRLQDVPRSLVDATIMTEDANFYTNPGIDPWSILRAIVDDVRYRRIMSGASTITQQLVRNVVMTPEERQSHSLFRKLGEAILAYRVSQRYSKDEILERYLNEIYYGNLAYGVEAASETYFGKPIQQLDLAQSALLAGLPQAPALYDPYQHPEAAKQRQREVLSLMVKHGAISQAQADAAAAEPLHYHPPSTNLQAPHFVMYVRNLLEQRYGRDEIYQNGLHVYTSLDLDVQRQAEATIQQDLPRLQANGARNAALVAIDPKTGEILAMVGSANFDDDAIQGQLNLATTERMPGAIVQTFTYAAAFDRHLIMPASLLQDAPVEYPMGTGQPPYQPRDADGKFRGPVTARRALANSLNVPVVRLLDQLGVDNLLTTLHRFGITSLDQPASYYGLGLTLGDGPARLLDLTAAYAVLANGGVQEGMPVADPTTSHPPLAPVAILKVTDAQGKVLDAYQLGPGSQLISEQAAWLVSDVLQDDAARAEIFGAHSALALPDRPAAVKAATSEDLKDAWAIGYTPQLAVGVWAGNANGQSLNQPFGAAGPAVIWHDFLAATLRGQPVASFSRPPGLSRVTVDARTGLLPAPGQPTITDWFADGTAPTAVAPAPTPPPTATAVPARRAPAPAAGPPAPHGNGKRRG